MQYDKPKYQWQLSVYKMKDSGHYNKNKKEVNNDKFQKGKRTDSTKQKEKKKKKKEGKKGPTLDLLFIHKTTNFCSLLSLYLVWF